MRRFGRYFLTTAAIIILLVNLVVILLYGRQFYACPNVNGLSNAAQSFCQDPELTGGSLGAMNLVLLLTFGLVWFGVVSYRRHHAPHQ